MNAQTLAQRAYAGNALSTRTDRSIEYELFARVTHRIKAAAEAGPNAYPRLVEALHENRKLWTMLAIDVADSGNKLPPELRAQIFYLAEFTQEHTGKLLARKARLAPLLEINAAVMRGLSGGRAKR
ncbi:MAG: flagellar biosynthesis regulator FlhF [Rhodobacteraceae bacterium]|uniref:flagellar biosynthesis regulator FlaF n=1 Tax=Salipiger TaxID=263377 RepID=UPI00031BB6B1|nr:MULTISPECIES: flagellar biosynthesis regulator FlaF [Salipiger]MAB05938.1 flagellar biosynthesis regulator FlhF [Paracoccaceae bacterium]GGA10598.1 flagellar biosynthesis regulatory protein FlaF [Salipiger profundus]SFC65741.1 flagellar protein FlaF [Salipiger profundus]